MSEEASVSSYLYVNPNGYAVRCVLEDDFVPDADFMLRIWENHDDGHNDGANGDENMPDRDANKRTKSVQSVGENGASGAYTGSNVPMQTTHAGFENATVPTEGSLVHNDMRPSSLQVQASVNCTNIVSMQRASATSSPGHAAASTAPMQKPEAMPTLGHAVAPMAR